ncbi:hypothetical protein GBT06_16680 [Escherichia coli]|nr:hypothetical protein [Escherichia coli]NNR39176.1 hypothetical protein [Escherichia coli]QGY18556.1 hypothetical protein F6P94_15430 [Escherichia coli]
MDNKIVDHRP